MQVSILDIDEEHGKDSVTDFHRTFGDEKFVFLKCNVEDDKELEGRSRLSFIICLRTLAPFELSVKNNI